MEHYNGGLRGSKWVKKKRCKKGEHAIGAEIGLHDDFGLSNYKEKWQYYTWYIYYYFASILNIRLYCSDYGEGGTRMIEGQLLNHDQFHHEAWRYRRLFKYTREKQR